MMIVLYYAVVFRIHYYKIINKYFIKWIAILEIIGRVLVAKPLYMEILTKLVAYVVKQNGGQNRFWKKNIVGELVIKYVAIAKNGILRLLQHVENVM